MLRALASDLYCPSDVGRAALAKDSHLARQTAHYKVNGERILRKLKERVRKPAKSSNHKLQPPATAKASRKKR